MFYAGGFIYNPKTKQVLLHLRDDKTRDNPNLWAFFGGTSEKNEIPIDTFQRELSEELGINTDKEEIKHLCNYFNPDFKTHRHVFYIERGQPFEFTLSEGKAVKWFNIDKVMNENLSKRTRQDLVFFINKNSS